MSNDLKTALEEEYGRAKQLPPRRRGEVPIPDTDLKVCTVDSL